MAANGTFISALAYLIHLWCRTEGYIEKSARTVTKLSWLTPTRFLLKKCKWLSINHQLVFYHSMLQVYKFT
jgi:hypothetical protein